MKSRENAFESDPGFTCDREKLQEIYGADNGAGAFRGGDLKEYLIKGAKGGNIILHDPRTIAILEQYGTKWTQHFRALYAVVVDNYFRNQPTTHVNEISQRTGYNAMPFSGFFGHRALVRGLPIVVRWLGGHTRCWIAEPAEQCLSPQAPSSAVERKLKGLQDRKTTPIVSPSVTSRRPPLTFRDPPLLPQQKVILQQIKQEVKNYDPTRYRENLLISFEDNNKAWPGYLNVFYAMRTGNITAMLGARKSALAIYPVILLSPVESRDPDVVRRLYFESFRVMFGEAVRSTVESFFTKCTSKKGLAFSLKNLFR